MHQTWLYKGPRLEDRIQNGRQNNFKLIRLIAALSVVFSHCFSSADPLAFISGGALNGGNLGLSVFFFLSGLLVSQSLDKSPSWKNFLWKRVLRIYPAACTAVLLCAFLLGPIVSSYSPKMYFSDPLFFQYLVTCSLLKIWYHLPGVFTHSPLGPVVNSSLWTLSLELKLYAGLLLLGLFRKDKAKIFLLWGLLVAGLAGGLFFYKTTGITQDLTQERTFSGPHFLAPYIRFGSYFVAGALCYYYRARLTISNYWIAAIPLFFLINTRFPFYSLAALIMISALVLYLAVHGLRLAGKFNSAPDLSYGIYVFAFPVQQLVFGYLHPGSPGSAFLLTLLLTLPLALGSWYLIEAKALKWKYLVK